MMSYPLIQNGFAFEPSLTARLVAWSTRSATPNAQLLRRRSIELLEGLISEWTSAIMIAELISLRMFQGLLIMTLINS